MERVVSEYNWSYYHDRQAEFDQTDTGVLRVLSMFDDLNLLTEEAVFISADVDEVVSRDVMYSVAWCEMSEEVVWGGLWMPMGELSRAMRVDNPSERGAHLFAQPTIYKFRAISEGRQSGRRLKSNVSQIPMIRGGVHLTAPAYLPNTILKEMTATEEQFYRASVNFGYFLSADVEDLNLEQRRIQEFFYKPMFIDKFGKFPWKDSLLRGLFQTPSPWRLM